MPPIQDLEVPLLQFCFSRTPAWLGHLVPVGWQPEASEDRKLNLRLVQK